MSGGITDGWYNNEIENYNPYYGMDTPTGDLEGYGHATQVIWKGSETVGCATYDCRGAALGMWYTVCNYYPFGKPFTFIIELNVTDPPRKRFSPMGREPLQG